MPQHKPPFEITAEWPTPIVRDFGLFLDAMEKPTAFLQKSRQTLDWTTLYALNQEMRTFRSDAHPRMAQKYYALLNLFQNICIAARLHAMGVERGKVRMIPTPNAAAFRALAPAERYMALLEALWVDCPWEDLFVFPFSENVWSGERLVRLLKSVPVSKPLTERYLRGKLRRPEGYLPFEAAAQVTRLLSFFGFLGYTVAPPRPGGYGYKGRFEIAEITVAPLGRAFFRVLDAERPLSEWNLPCRSESGLAPGSWLDGPDEEPEESPEPSSQEAPDAGRFIDAFLPLLAEGSARSGLPRLREELKDQTYVFRVSLVWGLYAAGEAWRTIVISSQDTLDGLHGAIQEAFDFDNDHLYAFHMDGKRTSRKQIMDPRAEESAPSAADVALGELGIFVGQTIRYIFDFGDYWNFDVKLTEIRDAPHVEQPVVLERHGENPQQYPDYDEEEE